MKENSITENYFGERLLEMKEEVVDDEKEEYIRKLLQEKQELVGDNQSLREMLKEAEGRMEGIGRDKEDIYEQMRLIEG